MRLAIAIGFALVAGALPTLALPTLAQANNGPHGRATTDLATIGRAPAAPPVLHSIRPVLDDLVVFCGTATQPGVMNRLGKLRRGIRPGFGLEDPVMKCPR